MYRKNEDPHVQRTKQHQGAKSSILQPLTGLFEASQSKRINKYIKVLTMLPRLTGYETGRYSRGLSRVLRIENHLNLFVPNDSTDPEPSLFTLRSQPPHTRLENPSGKQRRLFSLFLYALFRYEAQSLDTSRVSINARVVIQRGRKCFAFHFSLFFSRLFVFGQSYEAGSVRLDS